MFFFLLKTSFSVGTGTSRDRVKGKLRSKNAHLKNNTVPDPKVNVKSDPGPETLFWIPNCKSVRINFVDFTLSLIILFSF